ncbi:magnesium transporter NIPA-domain-containing protein [Chaetomium sp. MPI-CAGE-AT-0009]|nr:magnesium transporter NIPA-domain-containing protein [Chaetomium sp. MPI-CAGE-AT-0009]
MRLFPSLPPHMLGRSALSAWPAWPSNGDGDGDGDGNPGSPGSELQNWSSLIGIVTAICGNVLIALALNVQRYAHTRLHRKKAQIRERARQAMRNAHRGTHGGQGAGRYGAALTPNGDSNGRSSNGYGSGRYSDDDVRDSSETEPLAQSFRSDESADGDDDIDHGKPKVASSYLKDPYWWMGQVLITVGEMGNFLAYGFAPASIVSPLGVVALVSNCVIAPIFFKEVFRPRDFWGVIIAITGAVTVVLSAETEETKLGPHEVWDAITTMEFEIYLGVSCGLIVLLMWLSPKYGHRTILVDLGLVGLFGGYTVLATKGVSSMLSSTLFGAFTTPVTYVLIFILLSTAIMQVRYVNKALQRFDSTQVIPIQFVLFTLSVIIGSAVLYRDFERTTGEQAIKFIGGCLFTFFGVFLITSGRSRQEDDDEPTLSDAEGIEETIGLAEQDRVPPPTPPQPRRRDPPSRSGGSSRASRVSFSDTHDTGLPTPRSFPTHPRQSHLLDDDNDEDLPDAPLLSNPWHDATATDYFTATPGLTSYSEPQLLEPAHITALSSSAATTTTTTTKPLPPTPLNSATSAGTTPPQFLDRDRERERDRDQRPMTPRAPASASRLPPSHMYSPSPFSGTVSAVVGEKLRMAMRGHLHGPGHGQGHGHGNGYQGYGGGYDGGDENGHGNGSGASAEAEGESGGAEGGGGLRGRARSLSHTLGLAGLFGGGSGSGNASGSGSGSASGSGSGSAGAGTVVRRATVTRRETTDGAVFGGPLERARTTGDGALDRGSGGLL